MLLKSQPTKRGHGLQAGSRLQASSALFYFSTACAGWSTHSLHHPHRALQLHTGASANVLTLKTSELATLTSSTRSQVVCA